MTKLFTTILSLSLGLLFVFNHNCQSQDSPVQEVQQQPQQKGNELHISPAMALHLELESTKAGPQAIQTDDEFIGDIVVGEDSEVILTARVNGIIKEIFVKPGEKVKANQRLALIESKELSEMLIQYFKHEQDYRYAKEAYKRELQLFEKQASSQVTVQQKEHLFHTAEVAHRSYHQKLKVLGYDEAFLHQIWQQPHKDLTKYYINAPMEGQIIKRHAKKGQSVNEDAQLFVIANMQQLQVVFKPTIKKGYQLQIGQILEIISENVGLQGNAAISFISPTADKSTRTLVVKASIVNENLQWKPGMCVTVKNANVAKQASVAVPKMSLQEIDGKLYVFVIKTKNVYVPQRVETGMQDNTSVEILSGLTPGQQVVAKGSLSLKAEWLKILEE